MMDMLTSFTHLQCLYLSEPYHGADKTQVRDVLPRKEVGMYQQRYSWVLIVLVLMVLRYWLVLIWISIDSIPTNTNTNQYRNTINTNTIDTNSPPQYPIPNTQHQLFDANIGGGTCLR